MSDRPVNHLLDDIIEAIQKSLGYINGLSADDFNTQLKAFEEKLIGIKNTYTD